MPKKQETTIQKKKKMVDCHITAQYVHAVSELLSLKLYEYLLYRTCNRKMPRFPTVVCCVQ